MITWLTPSSQCHILTFWAAAQPHNAAILCSVAKAFLSVGRKMLWRCPTLILCGTKVLPGPKGESKSWVQLPASEQRQDELQAIRELFTGRPRSAAPSSDTAAVRKSVEAASSVLQFCSSAVHMFPSSLRYLSILDLKPQLCLDRPTGMQPERGVPLVPLDFCPVKTVLVTRAWQTSTPRWRGAAAYSSCGGNAIGALAEFAHIPSSWEACTTKGEKEVWLAQAQRPQHLYIMVRGFRNLARALRHRAPSLEGLRTLSIDLLPYAVPDTDITTDLPLTIRTLLANSTASSLRSIVIRCRFGEEKRLLSALLVTLHRLGGRTRINFTIIACEWLSGLMDDLPEHEKAALSIWESVIGDMVS